MTVRRAESRIRWMSPVAVKQEVPAHSSTKRPGRLWGWLLITALTLAQFAWLGYRWLGAPAWYAGLSLQHKQVLSLVETASLGTSAIIWTGLWWFQHRRDSRRGGANVDALSLPQLLTLEPQAFEEYVGRLFRQKGYRVKVRGASGDLGVDLELTDPAGRRAIVQCKRYQNTVGAGVARELYGTLVHEGVAHAFLVTTGEISESARAWSAGKPLTLIDGSTLVAIAGSLRDL